MTKYWVCWITQTGNQPAYAMALTNCCLTIEETLRAVKVIEERNEAVCLWVEEYEGDEYRGVPFIVNYVEYMGQRRKEPCVKGCSCFMSSLTSISQETDET